MVILRRATPEQTVESWRLNSIEWGDGMTTDEHIGRERAQYDTYADPSTSQINWVLLEDENSSEILCACESLLRPAVLSKIVDGKRTVQSGSGYGIASVFCRASLRGRGYATQMMAMVSEQLRKDDYLGGGLWSDIGPVFYAQFGWKSYPSRYSSFTVVSSSPQTEVLGGSWIDKDTLPGICQWDCLDIVKEVQKSTSGKVVWSFLPTYDVMRWHHARMFYVFNLRTTKPGQDFPSEINQFGYSISVNAWCTWTMQFSTKTPVLYILRLRYTDTTELSQLLEAAAVVACNYGMAKVVLWDPNFTDVKGLTVNGLQLEDKQERVDSLSALQVNSNTEDVEWLFNEKFCWC